MRASVNMQTKLLLPQAPAAHSMAAILQPSTPRPLHKLGRTSSVTSPLDLKRAMSGSIPSKTQKGICLTTRHVMLAPTLPATA